MAVEVDPDLRRATVWYTSLAGDEADHDVVDALAEHRSGIQGAIGRQARLKRTPELTFRPDTVIRQAERVEQILRDLGDEVRAPAPEGDRPEGAAGGT